MIIQKKIQNNIIIMNKEVKVEQKADTVKTLVINTENPEADTVMTFVNMTENKEEEESKEIDQDQDHILKVNLEPEDPEDPKDPQNQPSLCQQTIICSN